MNRRAKAEILRLNDLMELAVSEASDCQIAVSGLRIEVGDPTVYRIPMDASGNPRNLKNRWRIYVKNQRPEPGVPGTLPEPTLFLGGPDVSTTNGYPLGPQDFIVLDMTDRVQLYVVQQTGDEFTADGDVRTLELA